MAPTTPVMESRVNERSVWIFGYGSLIWNPGFKYSKRIIGYVEGYKRRLWQKNTTHRGTPNSVSIKSFPNTDYLFILTRNNDISMFLFVISILLLFLVCFSLEE